MSGLVGAGGSWVVRRTDFLSAHTPHSHATSSPPPTSPPSRQRQCSLSQPSACHYTEFRKTKLKIFRIVILLSNTRQDIIFRIDLFKRLSAQWDQHCVECWVLTNYLDIVRFCPANSPLINVRSIKNLLVLSPPHYAKYSDTEILTQWGWTYTVAVCWAEDGKINFERNEELIWLDCFTRMEFHVLAALSSRLNYVNM